MDPTFSKCIELVACILGGLPDLPRRYEPLQHNGQYLHGLLSTARQWKLRLEYLQTNYSENRTWISNDGHLQLEGNLSDCQQMLAAAHQMIQSPSLVAQNVPQNTPGQYLWNQTNINALKNGITLRLQDVQAILADTQNRSNPYQAPRLLSTTLRSASELRGDQPYVSVLEELDEESKTTATFNWNGLQGPKFSRELCKAAQQGNLAKMTKLLSKGANPNYQSKRWNGGVTATQMAVAYGHIDALELLFKSSNNIDLSLQDNAGNTVLHHAAEAQFSGVIAIVLSKYKQNSSLNARNKNGETSLHLSRIQEMELLLQAGADVNADDNDRQTPLFRAASRHDVKAVCLLLQNGADPNHEDKNGRTALWVACNSATSSSVQKCRKVLKHLHDHGAEQVAWGQSDKKSPIHLTAQRGLWEISETLIAYGADVDARTDTDMTALHLATIKGCPKTIKLLLEKGADPNSSDNKGWTSLHYAAQTAAGTKSVQVAQALVSKMGKIQKGSFCDNQNRSPLHYLTNSSLLGILADPQPAMPYSWSTFSTFGYGDSELDTRDINGDTPLHQAIERNELNTVIALVKHGASIRWSNRNGCTPAEVICSDERRWTKALGDQVLMEITVNMLLMVIPFTGASKKCHTGIRDICANWSRKNRKIGQDLEILLNKSKLWSSWKDVKKTDKNGQTRLEKALKILGLTVFISREVVDAVGWKPLAQLALRSPIIAAKAWTKS